MTLGAFASLVGADPKWIQNAAAALEGRLAFTPTQARRLAIARALAESTGMPLLQAWEAAAEALSKFAGGREPVSIVLSDPAIGITVDVYRLLARFAARLSWLRTEYQPRRRGRPGRRRDPVVAAKEYGLDPSLLRYNLGRSPAERLRQLDAMNTFRRRVRRV